jgi:hypothetical protein
MGRVGFFIVFLVIICLLVCECGWFALFTADWFGYEKDERLFMWWVR